MATMFVRHSVSDYKAWRKIYDDFAPNLKTMGVTSAEVYQSADDPRDITVTHEFPSIGAAQAFATDPELKAFVDYYLANSAALSTEAGYIALPDELLASETAEWAEKKRKLGLD